MRRLAALAALGGLWLAADLAAQDPAAPTQTFRTGVDLIRVDVTVLDKNRAPVRGLTAEDFTVTENGQLQRIVAIAEIDAATSDPAQSAWMRHTPRDVTTNDLADQLGDGQAVAIVLDDFSIPDDSTEMIVSARDIARLIVNSLGPSDVAAVVFPFKPGRTQDFTTDRSRLLAAIDKFEPEQPEYRMLQPQLPGRIEGDIQRYSPLLGRDPCFQIQPVIPTLRTVVSRLASVPNRRKALFFLSMGLNFTFTAGRTRCQGLLYDESLRMFDTAQRFNVNIHGIDPAGAAGYQRFLQQPRVRNVRMVGGLDLISARREASLRHDFLEQLGEQTGGRPVVDTDDLDAAVAQIFEEYGSYYLLGYETTNGEPDGKFRKLEIKVKNKDFEVRTRTGRWAPNKNSVVASGQPPPCWVDCWQKPLRAGEAALTGLTSAEPLKLRGAVFPLGRPAAAAPGRGNQVEVAAVLTVRLPPLTRSADETLSVVRTAYDADGRASPPVQETFTRRAETNAGDEIRYDVWQRFSLPPGRNEVRFSTSSRLADTSGSVVVEVDVPDLSRNSATASPIVLGVPAAGERPDRLDTLLPIVPTTARDFTKGEPVAAFLRVFAGAAAPPSAVALTVRVLDAGNSDALEIPATTIPAEAFGAGRSADYVFDVPLAQLKSGPHVLSITATFGDARTVRRDVVFRVR